MRTNTRKQAMHKHLAALILTLIPTVLLGQDVAKINTVAAPNQNVAKGVTFGQAVTGKWRVGAIVRGRGSRQSLLVTLPIPNDWPEQSVTLLEESLPENVQTLTGYRNLKTNNVRQMVAKAPALPGNVPVTISVTVQVRTKEIIEPEDKSVYVIPKSSHKIGKQFLGSSPFANFKNAKLRTFAKETTKDVDQAWEKVAAIYDWVRDEIQTDDVEVSNAVNTFRNKMGCNEDRVFLFVALCRAIKIPARIVYANEFYYAEFMLTDEDGKAAYWFPANINGVYELGSLAEPRIILQKGHYIKVPEKKLPQKYVAEYISVTGTKAPVAKSFRMQVEDEE